MCSKIWSKANWRNSLVKDDIAEARPILFTAVVTWLPDIRRGKGEQILGHFDPHGKIYARENTISQGLCRLLIICIHVHLQNHRRPPVATNSIYLAELGQPESLPGRCLTIFLKTHNYGDSIASSGALYLEEWKTALDVNHDMNINWKCPWRQICLISWDINIYCWCQSFGQRDTILFFPQNWNKFKPNHVAAPSITGILLISFLPVLKWKLSGLFLWFLMRLQVLLLSFLNFSVLILAHSFPQHARKIISSKGTCFSHYCFDFWNTLKATFLNSSVSLSWLWQENITIHSLWCLSFLWSIVFILPLVHVHNNCG